jgi:dolichol-phosphate mannosyltransferase
MLRLAIVIPTYNEAANIQNLINGIAEVAKLNADTDFTVAVIDDSSPDGTGALVERLAESWSTENLRVRLITKATKEGLGAAYIYGFTLLLQEDFDYLLQMDADMSHDPKYITGFIHQAKAGVEFVVASRYIKGGGTPDWTWNRKLLSRGGNIYARTLLSRKITDYTGGFNMFSAKLLHRIQINTIRANGYGYLLALKYRALLDSASFTELPLVFLDRTHGSSKIPSNTLIQSFLLVPSLKIRRGR